MKLVVDLILSNYEFKRIGLIDSEAMIPVCGYIPAPEGNEIVTGLDGSS